MKERLTGAIILVALIVLLVPELLTGPIRTKFASTAFSTAAPVSGTQPARGQPPLRSYTLTLGAAPPAQHADAGPAATAPAQPAQNAAQGPAQSPAQSPKESPAQSLKSPAGGPEEGGGPQHAMAPDGAETRAPRLPQHSARADSALQAAKSPTHPAMREARSSASASSAGWVVQLGSFASRQNADRLAHSLAGKGFRMSVSPARTGSRVLWRVRVGPAHDRAAAQHLAARLRVLGHRGELLPVR